MKGMALETIGFITIALVGVAILIILISGSWGSLTRNVFCYFYQNIFSRDIEMCEEKGNIPETVEINPRDSEDLARYIAAYSIKCWEDAAKSLSTKDTNCYNLIIENGPFDSGVDEVSVTDILLNEGGCGKLGNSDLHSECGVEDQLRWEITTDGYTFWENRGMDAAWIDGSGIHIVNGNWIWSKNSFTPGGSWDIRVIQNSPTPLSALTISTGEYYPWDNGGIDAAWVNAGGLFGITNGKWAWNWNGGPWNGPISLYEAPYWGDLNHAERGMEPSPDGYPWEGYGLDAGWTYNDITYITNDKWIWYYDPHDTINCQLEPGEQGCWYGPFDLSTYLNDIGEYDWSNLGLCDGDYYPWERGGIDAAWVEAGITFITNDKCVWVWRPITSNWLPPSDLSTYTSTSDNCIHNSECPITDQKLILIKYDESDKKIVVKG
jgi:hypothetical protein